MRYINRKNKVLQEGFDKDVQDNEINFKYKIVLEAIKTRKECGITQEELAKRMGTKQSNISRFENGNCGFTLKFLQNMAKAMNKKLKIKFE